jgi:ATP-dependent DNA helicase RecQ
MPADVPVLATTATANSRVVADVAEQLGAAEAGGGSEVLTIRGPLARSSLRLGVLRLPDAPSRLAWLLSHLEELPGSGIIYALTVAAAVDTARLLRDRGHEVRAYTGQTDPDERAESEAMLKRNEVKALVATSALGMGFDKPDLGVLHLGAPSSPVAYYQQVGRAGRASESADVLLLPGVEDRDIWHYFATASMPDLERAERHRGPGGRPVSTPVLEAMVDIRRTPLELLLKVLDVDGAVRRVQGGWVATGEPWVYDAERYDRIAAERRAEQQHGGVRAGIRLPHGVPAAHPRRRHRRAVRPVRQLCGVWYPTEIGTEASAAASASLDRVGVPIEPRQAWPTGADRLGVAVKGRIAAEEQAGRACSRTSHRPRLGRCAARALRGRRPRRAGSRSAARRVCAGAHAAGAGPSARSRSSRCRRVPVRCSSDPSRRASPRSVGCRTWANSPWSEAGPRAVRGNSAFRLAGVWDRFSPDALAVPAARCCSWTIRPTAGGRSRSPHGPSAVPERPTMLPFVLALRG